jgi:DNA-binding transcriptional ArsR family regulator
MERRGMAHTAPGPLSESAGEVFAQLARQVRATRPQLATACDLSKPTVSAAMAELEAAGLVERDGTAHGSTGRSAAVYRLARAAGYVLAVDRGSTQVSFRAIALDGSLLDEDQTSRPDLAWSMIGGALARRTGDGPLRTAVVAVSDVVLPDPAADPVTAGRVGDAVASLRLPSAVPVAVENNVNCAAIAELHDGGDEGRDTFGSADACCAAATGPPGRSPGSRIRGPTTARRDARPWRRGSARRV